MYLRPEAASRSLADPPLLESWNAKTDPAQVRLAAYLDRVAELVALPDTSHNLALELCVGVPAGRGLTSGGGDLDNFLLPIVRKLGAQRFDAVFGTKAHQSGSTITITPAQRASAPTPTSMRLRTSISADSKAWKMQVNHACAEAHVSTPQLDHGPLAVDIEFRVNSQRNWSTLWKPAIDSLGPVLGVEDPRRPFTPNDDRIVSLGLHRTVDDGLGWDVELSAWWRPAAQATAPDAG